MSGVLESNKALSGDDVRSSPVPGGVITKELGNVPWYSVGNWSCRNPVWLDQGLRVVAL